MNKIKTILPLLILMIVIVTTDCHSYRNLTHRAINTAVIQKKMTTSEIYDYFKVNLGYSSVNDEVSGVKILKWFEDAGAQEDKPAFRTLNHFLDPLTNKGFTGTLGGLLFSGLPTAVWAQRPTGKQSWGFYSWHDGREYFYEALTSDSQALREEKLAMSFRALGQVMHLVEDMSVPEHTRNTAHIVANTIEPWLEEVLNPRTKTGLYTKYYITFQNLLIDPISPSQVLLQQPGKFPGAPIPIANLYDSEQYTNGSSPDVTVTVPIGLAEYTNANFFSFNTIFENYEHPAWSSIELHDDTDDESGKLMTFIRRKSDAAGEHVEHLAQANVFSKHLEVVKTNGFTLENDKVYKDYMDKLIARAAGYAGALVDYFYRGTIEVQLIEGDVTFRSVRIKARNTTPNGEEMGPGEATLVIRYKALKETPLGGYRFLLNTPSDSDQYSYKVVKLQNVTIPRDAPVELTFDFSTDTLPLNFYDFSLQLVFKGTLGNEDCAVAVSKIQVLDGIYTDIDLSLPVSGLYAKSSDGSINATFNELRLTALTNIPGGLSIPDSRIELALEYRLATTDPFQSAPVDSEPSDAMSYIIRINEKNGVRELPQGVPVELVFDLSSIPLSVFATDVYANVVIAGTDSEGNPKTFAVGFNDISEPTPIDVFNNADKICMNSQWRDAGTPGTIALVDTNLDGISDLADVYAHNIANIFYKALPASSSESASSSNYTFHSPDVLNGGSYRRLGYILTDYSFKYSVKEDWLDTDPADSWVIGNESADSYNGTSVKNQCDTDENCSYPHMYNMRGSLMWWGAGLIYDNWAYPYGSSCSWDDLR
jgi:hypothetical protein